MPDATSPDHPGFRMSGGNNINNNNNNNAPATLKKRDRNSLGSKLPWARKDSSVAVGSNATTTTTASPSTNASTTNLPLMTEDVSAGAESSSSSGGGFARTIKRTASAGSLGKLLGDRLLGVTSGTSKGKGRSGGGDDNAAAVADATTGGAARHQPSGSASSSASSTVGAAWQKARKRFSAGSAASAATTANTSVDATAGGQQEEERGEGDAGGQQPSSRPGSAASGLLLGRSNAVKNNGKGRATSWGSITAAAPSTDAGASKTGGGGANNANGGHISFSSSTNLTDGAVANVDEAGRGSRRRKTSSSLSGLVGGKGLGLGLGGSGLAMTPSAAAAEGNDDDDDDDGETKPNTLDGVFANSLTADNLQAQAAPKKNDSDQGKSPAAAPAATATTTTKKNGRASVSNAADALARRMKIHRSSAAPKRSSSLDAAMHLDTTTNTNTKGNTTTTTTTTLGRRKSDSASTLLATPAKLMRYRSFLTTTSSGSGESNSKDKRNNKFATQNPNASTTALRGPSRTPSSESGASLPPVCAARNPDGHETYEGSSSYPTGLTSLSSPNLLLLPPLPYVNNRTNSGGSDSDERWQQQQRRAEAAAPTPAHTPIPPSPSPAAVVGGGGDRSNKRGSSPPMLPELPPPSDDYQLLGDFAMPDFERVEGADGRVEWVDRGTGRVLMTRGDEEEGMEREDEGEEDEEDEARREVSEWRRGKRLLVVASDRVADRKEEEQRPRRPERSVDDGAGRDQAKRTEIWVEELKKDRGAARGGGGEGEGEEEEAKDVEPGACAKDVDGGGSSGGDRLSAGLLGASLRSPSARSLTPRPNPAQIAAAHELAVRGRATLVEPGKRKVHDRTIPSQGSSVYSAPDTSPASPLTPPTSSGTPIPQDNDYVKDIQTELVDDRWADYGPFNEARMP
ncbi:hypothetical protein UCDDS831_g04998 [Diplodia seriata]|uniref:Uncharacterized protein n=1 Tax=Diplodia seriata TaxID=420778 RepID=A0A0G2EB42_9PEZI|nr:hypothetical protein UCDDS831_g04998 [Diplodia seriata]